MPLPCGRGVLLPAAALQDIRVVCAQCCCSAHFYSPPPLPLLIQVIGLCSLFGGGGSSWLLFLAPPLLFAPPVISNEIPGDIQSRTSVFQCRFPLLLCVLPVISQRRGKNRDKLQPIEVLLLLAAAGGVGSALRSCGMKGSVIVWLLFFFAWSWASCRSPPPVFAMSN